MSHVYQPDEIPDEWRELLLLIPGYSSIDTAGDAFFDADAAQRSIDFFHECVVHVEGALSGKPFILERWQQSFVANLFGWKRVDEFGRTVRRYRETLLYVARKNGKTPLCAGIALLVFFTDGEKGQQGYIAAGDKEQAGLLFRQCKSMVEHEPDLEKRCRIFGGSATAGQAKSIVREADNSYLKIVSADAHTKHGGNTHLAIIDELHVQPNRDLVDVFQSSFSSANRAQPLFVLITTADYDHPSICNEKHDYACKVRDGWKVPEGFRDQTFLPVVYEVPRDAKWDDETTWHLANPNLGISKTMTYMRAECLRAKEIPAYENTFRQLDLNQITSTASKCIPMDKWDICRREFDLKAMSGREVHVALDIGATSDFTAMVLLFPEDDGETIEIPTPGDPDGPTRTIVRRTYKVVSFFWLPEEPVKRDHRMQSVIDGWRKEGYIRTTYGNVVDYDQVLEDMIAILDDFFVLDIAFDRGFQGSQMGNNLMRHYGEHMIVQFAQGVLSFNAPFREMLELLALGRLHHDGNPVLRWMAANVMAERKGGLIKPSKDKSPEKIDGITALCMAMGRATAGGSVYDNGGVKTI